ncbi:DUF3300 domain-containing protein [Brumicola nitratireducens]|uniref:DUF3300 domain-containing protein n=1 Tax=Glaciecola nitratireducens (strain JCM 12485 / KCTC 12276 / FR1064) TaxID=1085623 RepID=G4QF79_GLANF|nr:DUF3300 domain-containing protein [Glaciecola nitratireducens]AEP28423.1 hypothetical protein GNIT_0269 [Glaciecola nitratireducens FR1064]
MNTNQKVTTSKVKLSASVLKALGYTALLTVSLTMGMHYAQATSLQSNKVYGFQKSQSQSEYDQIDAALAPIALYPDSLLTHILIASTYPLEVIEAARFIQQHPKFNLDDYEKNGLDQSTIEAIQDDALDYGWDASVVALTAFPDILNNMSDDLGWLSDLGDAFTQDQELVLGRVQKLREMAYDQGNLQNDEQLEVVVEREQETRVIVIQPRRHDIVYVPYYDVDFIYGPSWHVASSYRWSRPYYARHYRHNNVYFTPGAYIGTRLLFGGIFWSNHHHVSINRDWSYRKARSYSYRNTHYKRVQHKEYQRWTPAKPDTRHTERQKYAGNKSTHSAYKRNAWVSNKQSEFAKVQHEDRKSERKFIRSTPDSKRQLSNPKDKGEQKQKLQRQLDKSVVRQPRPIEKTEIQRKDRGLNPVNAVKQERKTLVKQERFERKVQSQREVSRPQRELSQPNRDISRPKRQVSKQQREVARPQRQKIQRTKTIKRSKE